MTALSKPASGADAGEQAPDQRLRLLRELGSQAVPAWAALESVPGERARLVIVERADRTAFDDGEIADWIRDARRLGALDHPNIVRVRDVVIRRGHVLVVSDFVDGVRWKELAPKTSLETALRVLVDALTGLSALHNLRDVSDPKRPLFKLVHGGLTPDCIVVGLDGVARIAGVSRLRSATARLAGTGSAYLAPEVLLEDDSADARADIYSVGVMLWEALSQRRFLPNLQPSAIVTQLLSGRVPPVTLPESVPWAAPLAGVVVTRALSADPEKRFSTAAAMAAEVRRIGGVKLPMAIRVAATVRDGFGEAAKVRRKMLEHGEVRPSEVTLRGTNASSDELSVDVSDEVVEEAATASQTASTVPPPGVSPEKLPVLVPLGPVNVAADPPAAAPPRPVPAAVEPAAPVVLARPKPPAAVEPAAPVVLARPKPPAAVEPAAPVVLARPKPPAAVEPAAPVVVAPPKPVPPVVERPPSRVVAPPPRPPAVSPLEPAAPEITTAAPFALATPAQPGPVETRPGRPKGLLGFAAAGAAVLTIGVVAWWIASRGSDTPPAITRVPPAIATPAAPPASAERAATALAPPAPPQPPASDVTPASVPVNPTGAPAVPPVPVNTPTPAARPLVTMPASSLPSKPKRPGGHAYDPQGI